MIVFIFLVGLIFGSFINALVWRLRQQLDDEGAPRKLSAQRAKELSILKGRSMCPSCKHQLAGRDLVPVLSWLLLRGRCRYCQKAISAQYLFVELMTGIIFAVTYVAWPPQLMGSEWVVFASFLAALVCMLALAIYDLHWKILPTKLIYFAGLSYGAGLLFFAVTEQQYERLVEALGSAGVYFAIFFAIYKVSELMQKHTKNAKEWLGFGDVRLAFVLGLVAGSVLNVFLAMFIASLLGLLFTLPSLLSKKAGMQSQIPFGPFLIAGAWVAFLWGETLFNGYTAFLDRLLV